VSPGDLIRNGRRRLLAEEHIVYAAVLLAVVIASTMYAIQISDHSENVWVVYGAVVAGIFGRSSPRTSPGRKDDTNDDS
jgi:hypothetical protein